MSDADRLSSHIKKLKRMAATAANKLEEGVLPGAGEKLAERGAELKSKASQAGARLKQEMDSLKASQERRRREAAEAKAIKKALRRESIKRFLRGVRNVTLAFFAIVLCVAIFNALTGREFKEPSADSQSQTGENSAQPNKVTRVEYQPTPMQKCYTKGRAYYRDIEAYPLLSTGEKAEVKIQSACLASPVAFGE